MKISRGGNRVSEGALSLVLYLLLLKSGGAPAEAQLVPS